MRLPRAKLTRFLLVISAALFLSGGVRSSVAQSNSSERDFPQSKAAVEKALKDMQSAMGGRLPVLDGFATSADHPLDRYQRGYYQSKVQVSAAPGGGSIVRVSAQVTAWYADPAGKSGYQVLNSNGRLEADLLDQLADLLAGKASLAAANPRPSPARKPFPSEKSGSSQPSSPQPSSSQFSAPRPTSNDAGAVAKSPEQTEPGISAPVPQLPQSGGFSSSLAEGLAEEKSGNKPGQKIGDDDPTGLKAEAASLEEILKNQAHPKNLVAVKKNGTAVVSAASLTAKTLFLASAHDEFEMLDFNRDWVHVRISGLSRGWIWRNSLEMPASVPDSDAPAAAPVPAAAELFHVTREETSPFPGDWAPLRGRTVKIVSVEENNESGKDAGPKLRLEFAKSVLDKGYPELAQKAQELAGIVVIFDSVDGGMIAAALPTLQQWKAGKLTDAGLWHQCFFDPPETFSEPAPTGAAASQ